MENTPKQKHPTATVREKLQEAGIPVTDTEILDTVNANNSFLDILAMAKLTPEQFLTWTRDKHQEYSLHAFKKHHENWFISFLEENNVSQMILTLAKTKDKPNVTRVSRSKKK